MNSTIAKNTRRFGLAVGVILSILATNPSWGNPQPSTGLRQFQSHLPHAALARAQSLGRLSPDSRLELMVSLPLRNPGQFQDFLARIYDPEDPLYGHYLNPRQFAKQYGATEAEYEAVAAEFTARGFKVAARYPNRLALKVNAPTNVVEETFQVRLQRYRSQEGRTFHAPDRDPMPPSALKSRLLGVAGLHNAPIRHSHYRSAAAKMNSFAPMNAGTGPSGGLSPKDITTAYNLQGTNANGSGQVIGLLELTGYNAGDIAAYRKYFNLPAIPLQNILIDGFSGRASVDSDEAAMDIELAMALAPGAGKILVYEGPNTESGFIDILNRMANDNLAMEISISWGSDEASNSSDLLASENQVFQQMAAQGQSVFAPSGDNGAYDDGQTLSVDDPCSQTFVVCVGGTELFTTPTGVYVDETTWNDGSISRGASGGGISQVWAIPDYQANIKTLASTQKRNVPDVALNADPDTGYAVYTFGSWQVIAGTSAGAPLWAAFTARVNQQRLANGVGLLGFANPVLYRIAQGPNYPLDFHDIADGSSNLYYVANPGYDNATGWGSFNGALLLADLAKGSGSVFPPATPASFSAAAGNRIVTLNWAASPGATGYNLYRGLASGQEKRITVKPLTSTQYTDKRVANSRTYFYRLTALNNIGESALSGEVSATPRPLAITANPVVSPAQTTAQITWSTSLAASSLVRFGTHRSRLTQSVSDPTPTTAHSLTLTNLSPATQYYFIVSSTLGGKTVRSKLGSFLTPG